jgi:hypothetical protein
MEYTIKTNNVIEITLYARDYYSRNSLVIEPGETYRIVSKKCQYWWDWFIPSAASGYWNPLAIHLGLRVKTAKCFSLCGAYNRDENTVFEICTDAVIIAQQNKRLLYFFANDNKKAYWNNWGRIKIIVERLS